MRLSNAVADQLASRILGGAVEQGLLPDRPLPDWDRYKIFRHRIRNSFIVPQTSITPLMARVLYGIAAMARPARILCIGSYMGNGLVWMAGPGFGPDRIYRGSLALGVDTDCTAVGQASENFTRAEMGGQVECRCLDGLDVPGLGQNFDMVLLDADDQDSRKEIYYRLLDVIYPLVDAGGLILAHDIAVPKFRDQLLRYRELVRDPEWFTGSSSLEIDECGLEVSRTASSQASRPAGARQAGWEARA